MQTISVLIAGTGFNRSKIEKRQKVLIIAPYDMKSFCGLFLVWQKGKEQAKLIQKATSSFWINSSNLNMLP